MSPKQTGAAKKSKLYPGEKPKEDILEFEEGVDQFLFVEPDKVRKAVRKRIDRTLRREAKVSAEDTVGTANEGLTALCEKNNVKVPPQMVVTGGENDFRDFGLLFDLHGITHETGEQRLEGNNIYGVCDDAGHSFNRGAIMFNYDDSSSETSLFLAQSEQYDQLAANRANAAVITAGYENAADSAVGPEEVVNKAAKSVETIAEEFGEAAKPMDLTAAKLVPTTKRDTFELQLSGLGNNKCIIMNPLNGKVRIINPTEKEQKVMVASNEVVMLATPEIFKVYESKKEPAEMQMGNRLFMETQMGKPLKDIGDELIEECHAKGYDTSISMVLMRVPEKIELGFPD